MKSIVRVFIQVNKIIQTLMEVKKIVNSIKSKEVARFCGRHHAQFNLKHLNK